MRIDADGDGNVVDFGVAEKLVGVDFKAVEHFAAQGQDGLSGFVAGEFGGAAGGVAFDEEEFVFADVFAFAVGQFAGQDGDAAAFFLFDFFNRTHPRLCLTDGEFGDFFAEVHVLVQPQFQRVARYGSNEFQRVAVGQFVFGLTLELRVEDTGGEDEGSFAEHVVALYFHAAR